MAIPAAQPGLVFRYDFVWSHEARRRRPSGKDRPACLAVATDTDIDPQVVVILPVTHSKPLEGTAGVEIPLAVRRAIGQDDQPCWVIVSEFNIDEWPSPGMSPLPGRPNVFAYGVLPSALFEQIKAAFLRCYDPKRAVRR